MKPLKNAFYPLLAVATLSAAVHAENTPPKAAQGGSKLIEAPSMPLPENTRIVRDIIYKHINGRELKLDVYLPAQSHANKPLLIWFHGGAWRRGNKADLPMRNSRLTAELLNNGYAVASVEYRLSGEAKFPAQIQDANDALYYLAAHASEYGWHADNMMLGGRSAGAHLAALTALPENTPTQFVTAVRPATIKIKAAAVFFGIYDLIALGEQKNNPKGGSETTLLGASPASIPDIARAASPLNYVGRNSPPVVILHGLADRTVPHTQSAMLYAALQKAGVNSELHLVTDAKHGDAVFDNEENVRKTIQFLNRHR